MNPTTHIGKRFFGLLIALVFAASFLACGKDADDQQQTVAPAPVPPPPELEPPPAVPEQPAAPEPAPLEPVKPVERIPEPVTPKGEWTVQIGTYSRKQNASTLAETLRKKGYQAYVVDDVAGKRALHRVFVGEFATRQEAQAVEKTVESKEGFKDAFVVRQAKGKSG